eukprot:GEMP01018496.1.p1 GENE.GEMP01018496.1~~GEMP01018496.1.p1  ORF type:complete len:254 (+),score=8.22 GEMP01018496.1:871-1632(+)
MVVGLYIRVVIFGVCFSGYHLGMSRGYSRIYLAYLCSGSNLSFNFCCFFFFYCIYSKKVDQNNCRLRRSASTFAYNFTRLFPHFIFCAIMHFFFARVCFVCNFFCSLVRVRAPSLKSRAPRPSFFLIKNSNTRTDIRDNRGTSQNKNLMRKNATPIFGLSEDKKLFLRCFFPRDTELFIFPRATKKKSTRRLFCAKAKTVFPHTIAGALLKIKRFFSHKHGRASQKKTFLFPRKRGRASQKNRDIFGIFSRIS